MRDRKGTEGGRRPYAAFAGSAGARFEHRDEEASRTARHSGDWSAEPLPEIG